eukprot:COSAG04_NODE_18703_length_434_cov_1.074627_1_plen_25_part_10
MVPLSQTFAKLVKEYFEITVLPVPL